MVGLGAVEECREKKEGKSGWEPMVLEFRPDCAFHLSPGAGHFISLSLRFVLCRIWYLSKLF